MEANEGYAHMNKNKKPENALKWINKALDNKDVVMASVIEFIKVRLKGSYNERIFKSCQD